MNAHCDSPRFISLSARPHLSRGDIWVIGGADRWNVSMRAVGEFRL